MLPKSTPEPIKNRAHNKVYKKTQKHAKNNKKDPKAGTQPGGNFSKKSFFFASRCHGAPNGRPDLKKGAPGSPKSPKLSLKVSKIAPKWTPKTIKMEPQPTTKTLQKLLENRRAFCLSVHIPVGKIHRSKRGGGDGRRHLDNKTLTFHLKTYTINIKHLLYKYSNVY